MRDYRAVTPHIIPPTDFAALELQLAPDAELVYVPGALRDFCRANRIDTAILDDEDFAMAAIAHWYVLHRHAGGKPDPAAETVVAMVSSRAG